MKQLNILLAAVIFCSSASAQNDPAKSEKKSDTLRIGNMVIIKKGKGPSNGDQISFESRKAEFERRHSKRVSTNWGIVDLGFANYDDQTDYAAANAGPYLVSGPSGYPNLSKSDFKLRAGKSVNVNIWFFMQRINLIKKNVNLKYGLGLELNNYRYKSTISYKEGGEVPYAGGITNNPFIFRDSISFSKNKLAADYLTIPVMLNFSTTPRLNRPTFSASFGVSAGYLYSQRNKQVSNERGKLKNKGDYDLERFKLSYVAELGLGPVRLYGSYSPKSMYDKDANGKTSLDIRPYNFGIRFSSW